MTKSQRDQIVEILRCAADLSSAPRPDSTSPYYEALAAIGSGTHYEPSSHYLAWSARCELMREMKGSILEDFTNEEYRDALLEAAARVEEKSWP